jgi:hypothetical protein
MVPSLRENEPEDGIPPQPAKLVQSKQKRTSPAFVDRIKSPTAKKVPDSAHIEVSE